MSYTLIDTVTTANPTTQSNQRKLVETSLGTIVLFSRVEGSVGIDIKYKTSTDGGSTWSAWNDALAVANVADNPGDFDIHIDTNNDILLTWTRSNGSSILFRKLTYSTGSWSNGTIYTIKAGNVIIPCITRRANGDIWVGSNDAATNKIWAWDSVDEGVNWVQKAETATTNNPNQTDIIIKGSDIWFVVRDGGELAVLKWSGSWAVEVITNTLPSSGGTLNVLRVSDSEIYIATNTASGIKVYLYNGSTWDAGTLVSNHANDTQPSLGTSQTYVAVVWKDYDGSNYNVAYKTNITGSWGNQVDLTDDAVVDTQISAIENTTSGKIYTIWTRINSYDIVFSSAIIAATEQLAPVFQFAGVNRYQASPNPEFQWRTIYENKFCPNLINFEYKWEVPSINISTSPVGVYGCLYGYSIYMRDTGSSGSTIIEVYAAGVLKKTITIAATGLEHKDVYYFGMTDELRVLDELTVKVTQVANNSSLLKLNLYQMSFPFILEPLFYGNIKDSAIFSGQNNSLLIDSADNWIIEFNQPINSVTKVEANSTQVGKIEFTATLSNGLFKNSRVSINPYTTLPINTLQITVEDAVGQIHSFSVFINNSKRAIVTLDFVGSSSQAMTALMNFEVYRYGFDGSSWSSWASKGTANNVTIDFSSQSEGNLTLYMQYMNGSLTYTETIAIGYYPNTQSSSLKFGKNVAELAYSDTVPINKVEIYSNGVLNDTLNPLSFTGFNTVARDGSTGILQAEAGTVYYKGNSYSYTPVDYVLTADTNASIYWLALFCFNTNTNAFEWLEVYSDPLGIMPNLSAYLIVIYKLLYYSARADTTDIRFPGTIDSKQKPPLIDLDIEGTKDISVKVYDVAGRVATFTLETLQTLFTNYSTLTVTDALSNVIKQGQIHFESELTYTINREDRE